MSEDRELSAGARLTRGARWGAAGSAMGAAAGGVVGLMGSLLHVAFHGEWMFLWPVAAQGAAILGTIGLLMGLLGQSDSPTTPVKNRYA
jgi:hypothetical protein